MRDENTEYLFCIDFVIKLAHIEDSLLDLFDWGDSGGGWEVDNIHANLLSDRMFCIALDVSWGSFYIY